MTAFTVPATVLVAALFGTWIFIRLPLRAFLGRVFRLKPAPFDPRFRFVSKRSWIRPARGLDPKIGLLLLLNGVFPIVLISLPSTPIFGGTKHWMTGYPFLCLLAGIAISRLIRQLMARRPVFAIATVVLPFALAIPGLLGIVQTHPFGLSQYTAAAGGVAGAADLGLNRQFWANAPRDLLPWINERYEKGARVYFHDINFQSYREYQTGGLLRKDIVYSGMELPAITGSNHAMIVHELHFKPIRLLDLGHVRVAGTGQGARSRWRALGVGLRATSR